MRFEMSASHMQAVNRKRRVVIHCDAQTTARENGVICAKDGNTFFENFQRRLWGYIDTLEHSIDSIHWDACMEDEFSPCRKSVLPLTRQELYRNFQADGVDLYQEYVDGCKKRGLETILSHRISGIDDTPGNAYSPTKIAHPEYYIDDWQRGANLECPEIRKMKLDMLTECMENYAFDGLEIDFCRHTPYLEPGHQWEKREHVTEFMRSLREMTLRIEREQGRAVLLSARVPNCVEGCHADGIDIEQWAEESIVDTITLGTRSFEVDIRGMRKATRGKIKLFPSYDCHHQSDAYHDPDAEICAGVFGNWWDQGADSIVLFNMPACNWKTYAETTRVPGRKYTHHWEEMLTFAGDPLKISTLNKTYVVERRGGYPWCNGFANTNCNKQLPIALKNNNTPDTVMLYVGDALAYQHVESVQLHVLVYGLLESDRLTIKLNNSPLMPDVKKDVRDKEIIPLGKELVSGYHPDWLPERDEVFDRCFCNLNPDQLHKGENYITVSVKRDRYPFCSRVEIERVELHVKYQAQ